MTRFATLSSFAALASSLLIPPATAAESTPDPYANETPAQRNARMQWWREARFGMFIHWGVYSVPAGSYQDKAVGGIGEWIMFGDVFDWPKDGQLPVPGLRNPIRKAYLLAGRKALRTTPAEAGVTIAVPGSAPDPISSTVVLEIRGNPEVEPALLRQSPDGSITLPASEATLRGRTLRFESGANRDNIGFWTDPEDWVEWPFKVNRPGRFNVRAVIAALGAGGFELTVGQQTLRAAAPVTGDYGKFVTTDLGRVEIPTAGAATLAVKPVPGAWQPINLKSVILTPAK